MMKVYSYDIFETCLIRTCGRAAYVFDILAERVLGEKATETMCMDFSNIRKDAEISARKKYITSEIEEVTLEQIYNECDFTPITSLSNNFIMKMEMELEKEILVPVFSTKKQIDEFRNRGYRIIFISDMYMPRDFILDVLKSNGFFVDGDSLYVSSDVKKTKATGNLYRFIQKKEDISLNKWRHVGDNKTSDYIVPKRLGIKAHYAVHKYTTYETVLSKRETEGGKLNRHILASISRAIRLSHNFSPELFVASDFVAPIYVPFVYYIMEHAAKNGIKNIFFLARDGFIFYKISERFVDKFPNVKIHYLYVSRKALYLPSLENLSYENLKERLVYLRDCNVEDVCERFQIFEESYRFSHYNSFKGEELFERILRDGVFLDIIARKRDEQRNLCIRYFEQEGLSESNSAIVDLSGSRRCHAYINNILNAAGYKSVFGYYFDVTHPHIVGLDYLSILQVARNKYNKAISKDPQSVFEQYFSMSFHESTASYMRDHNRIKPIFSKTNEIDSKTKFVLNNNIVACQMFADNFINLVNLKKSKDYIGDGLYAFNYFSSVPEIYFVRAFTNIRISNTSLRYSNIISKRNFIYCLLYCKSLYWKAPNLVYNCRFHGFITFLCKIRAVLKDLIITFKIQ